MTKQGAYRPPYKLVEVIWDDAASNSESWTDINDIAEPERVITIGFKVKDTAEYVSIAGSVSMEKEYEDTVGNTMTVPRGMIVSMREIKVSNAIRKSRHKIHPQSSPEAVHREPSEG